LGNACALPSIAQARAAQQQLSYLALLFYIHSESSLFCSIYCKIRIILLLFIVNLHYLPLLGKAWEGPSLPKQGAQDGFLL